MKLARWLNISRPRLSPGLWLGLAMLHVLFYLLLSWPTWVSSLAMDCVCEWSNCVFISKPLRAYNTVFKRWVRLRRSWCMYPWIGIRLSLVLIWNPKWSWKILMWLRFGSLREIEMVPPARIVTVGKWIVDWAREILGCLNLFLNKFWVLFSHGANINRVGWTETERPLFLLCEVWDLTRKRKHDVWNCHSKYQKILMLHPCF